MEREVVLMGRGWEVKEREWKTAQLVRRVQVEGREGRSEEQGNRQHKTCPEIWRSYYFSCLFLH